MVYIFTNHNKNIVDTTHFHLWNVRFDISSPLLKSILSIHLRLRSSKVILRAL